MTRTVKLSTFDATRRALAYPVRPTSDIVDGLYSIAFGATEAESSGPVRMVEEFSRPPPFSWASLLALVMLLNVWVGLFNLLPLPRLDGARLAILAYQLLTKRRAGLG